MGPEYCIYLAMRNVGLLALDCHALSEDLDVVDFNPRGKRKNPDLEAKIKDPEPLQVIGSKMEVTLMSQC